MLRNNEYVYVHVCLQGMNSWERVKSESVL